ncbi:uncharacterized protein NECHADRAFT_32593 [Fusarium vanettenii 77-13-4]|uniref:Uncharacterized protein n=1 Tax=Fusarium vanettenii (strain ATCC MYA-4622 / CBS 123669 / FGSC 9596 / NRRL 45880 / 77-13-4) TaxID=660122 RepID=C7Z611_FUSV7|nr:uncharacterized protein NECHADRAFT_32593 [Fusarium vanettenii 77-13-4]EEU40045.1 hypothetical protein NECHADRAFT_32593 [Fusarium vanettenii 77-13-4]
MSEKSKALDIRPSLDSESEAGPSAPNEAPPPSFQESVENDAAAFKTQFACIEIRPSDRIRLINFEETDISAVHQVVRTTWSRGIDRVRPFGESREMKLHGTPWSYKSNGDDDARRLLLHSLVFRKQEPAPSPCDWIAVSFDSNDKLKIIGSPPPELVTRLLQAFSVEIQRHEATADRVKIKFWGHPWTPSGQDTVATSLKLLSLLKVLEICGFTLYGTVGARHEDDTASADIMVCQRQKDWIPGAPILHR